MPYSVGRASAAHVSRRSGRRTTRPPLATATGLRRPPRDGPFKGAGGTTPSRWDRSESRERSDQDRTTIGPRSSQSASLAVLWNPLAKHKNRRRRPVASFEANSSASSARRQASIVSTMPGTIACDPPPQPSKRKKTKDKWASLQRGLKRGMQRRLPSKAPAVKAPLRIPGRRKRAACGRQSSPSDVKERLGDIPRTINTLDERLLLPTLSSDDDVDSRCDTASLCSCSDSDAGGGETSSPTQTLAAESCDAVRSAAAESYDDVRCAPRRPSLEGMPDYVAALSPEVRDRDPAATSEALRRLRALSEGSKDLRLAMVRGGAAQDDDSSHGPLVPSLLSLAGASGGENVDRWRLSALSILHALSVPSANKRPMASDSGCGAVRILADLLRDGDGDDDERRASSPEVRRRAVVTVVELTFGDEDRPLSLDPDDERARRMVGRVVRFLELWRTKGLPWDFRALYGVNVGLCAA